MDRYKCGLQALNSEDLLKRTKGYPPIIELDEPTDIVDSLNGVQSFRAKEFLRFSKTVLIYEVHAEKDVVFASGLAMNNILSDGNVSLLCGGSICAGGKVYGNFESYSNFRTMGSLYVGGDLIIHGSLYASGYGDIEVEGNMFCFGTVYARFLKVGKKLTCNEVNSEMLSVSGKIERCTTNISSVS